MSAENRLFEDLSRVASGAFSVLRGVGDEVEARMREQFERALARLDLVKREEFEAVQAMAAQARIEQEALETRLRRLEETVFGSGESRAESRGTEGEPA